MTEGGSDAPFFGLVNPSAGAWLQKALVSPQKAPQIAHTGALRRPIGDHPELFQGRLQLWNGLEMRRQEMRTAVLSDERSELIRKLLTQRRAVAADAVALSADFFFSVE